MKFYSEHTKQFYDTAKECEEAELTLKREKEAETAKANQRKADAEVVKNAYAKILEAQKEFNEKREDFIKKYGSYHMTFHDGDFEIEPLKKITGNANKFLNDLLDSIFG